jgi:hypothetical protein
MVFRSSGVLTELDVEQPRTGETDFMPCSHALLYVCGVVAHLMHLLNATESFNHYSLMSQTSVLLGLASMFARQTESKPHQCHLALRYSGQGL